MAGPVKKFYGNINVDGLTKVKHLIEEHEKFGKQLKINAAQWEDGNITIDVWDKEAKQATKLGSLRVSTFDNNNAAPQQSLTQAPAGEPDLPF